MFAVTADVVAEGFGAVLEFLLGPVVVVVLGHVLSHYSFCS